MSFTVYTKKEIDAKFAALNARITALEEAEPTPQPTPEPTPTPDPTPQPTGLRFTSSNTHSTPRGQNYTAKATTSEPVNWFDPVDGDALLVAMNNRTGDWSVPASAHGTRDKLQFSLKAQSQANANDIVTQPITLNIGGTAPTPSPGGDKAPLYPNSVGSAEVAHLQLIRWDEDPNYLNNVTYLGFIETEWVDSDDSTPIMQMAHDYRVTFTDSKSVDVRIDKDMGDEPAARVWADICAQRLGVQPKVIRDTLKHVHFVSGGLGGATAEDQGHFFFIYEERAKLRISQNKLEETFFHEGCHAAIQKFWLDSAEWKAAVAADNAHITTYAMKNAQEDFAESGLFAYAVLKTPDRFSADELTRIKNQIPNRIAVFEKIFA